MNPKTGQRLKADLDTLGLRHHIASQVRGLLAELSECAFLIFVHVIL